MVHTPSAQVFPKIYFYISIEGVKNTVNLKRVIADSTFEVHQPDDCSGSVDITFNNRYVLRYKRVDVQSMKLYLLFYFIDHTRFVMHMIGMNATVSTESGVNHLKSLLNKYCPLLEVTTGVEINLMRQCRRFAFREFHAHFAGSYYIKDGKTYITLIDPFSSPSSAEPVPFDPIECPTYPNEDSGSGGSGSYNKPTGGSGNEEKKSDDDKKDEKKDDDKKDEKKDDEKKEEKKSDEKSVAPTTVSPTTAAPTTAAPTTVAPTKA